MKKKQRGEKMTPSITAVVEVYETPFRIPANLRAKFEKDPEKVLKNFLQQQGKKVNAVTYVPARRGARARVRAGWYHYVWPMSLASRWIFIER